MGVWKNEDGRWCWRTRVTNKFTGAKARLSGTAPLASNRRESAEADERLAIDNFRMNPALRPSVSTKPTLAEFVEGEYRPWQVINRKAASTITGREVHLRAHILPKLGHLRLDEITKPVVAKFAAYLLESPQLLRAGNEGTGTLPRSVSTVRANLVTLRTILLHAVDKDILADIPRFPKLPKETKKAPNFLDYAEEKKLHEAARSPFEKALFMVATRCGLRAGEQKALRWQDLNFKRKTLSVKQNFVQGEFKPPKGRAERPVDLDDETIAALQALSQKAELVFLNADGSMLDYDDLEKSLDLALKRAGITRHVRWHDLRHTFGSHLVMSDVELIVVRDLMGHQSVKTTEVYSHLCRKNGRDAVDKATRARLADAASVAMDEGTT